MSCVGISRWLATTSLLLAVACSGDGGASSGGAGAGGAGASSGHTSGAGNSALAGTAGSVGGATAAGAGKGAGGSEAGAIGVGGDAGVSGGESGGAPTGTGGTNPVQGGAAAGGVAGSGGGSAGMGGAPPVTANAIYAAPNGAANAAGTLENPTTLAAAVSKVAGGGTIYLRGGKYGLASTISLSKSGASNSRINLRGYPLDAERPLLDFSSQASGSRGLNVSGSYWYIYGIDVFSAGGQLYVRQRLEQHRRVHDVLRM